MSPGKTLERRNRIRPLDAPPPQPAHAHLDGASGINDAERRTRVRKALAYLEKAVLPWEALEPGAVTDLLLAGAELVDNALRHAGPCTVRVRWMREVGRARVEVADASPVLPIRDARGDGVPCRGLGLVEDITVCWGWEKSPGATGKVVFAEVSPTQALTGTERLTALVRRHPIRADGSAQEVDGDGVTATQHREQGCGT